MIIREYKRAQSIEEALSLCEKKHNAVLGGGTWLRLGSRRTIQTAIDLSALGLDTIEETAEEFTVGAMVSLRAYETHQGLENAFLGLCRRSVEHIVGVQFRACATIGGSVWGRFGFSEVLCALMALGAQVELARGGRMPLAAFAQKKPDRDILLRVFIPKGIEGIGCESMRSQQTDFPILCVAAVRRAQGLSLCIGARPMRACVLEGTREEGLLARAASEIRYGTNARGGGTYRGHLAQVLSARALEEARR